MKSSKFVFMFIILLISIIGIEKVSGVACSGAPTSGCSVSGGLYQMPFNQTFFVNDSAIVLFAANSIIDCNYSTMIGNGTVNSVGIEISQNNVTVKNCNISGYYQNIKSSTKIQNYIYNNTFGRSTGGNVMWLYRMNNSIIAGNTFTSHNNSVIYFFGGTYNNQIYNNTFLDNISSALNYNIIIMNTSSLNGYSDNFSIHDNIFNSNCFHIYLQGVNYSNIYNNQFYNTVTKYAFDTQGLYNSNVFNNNFYNNFYSISIRYSYNNSLYNNTIDANSISGSHGLLVVYSSYNNLIYNNSVTRAQFGVLHEWDSINNTYYYNTVTNSNYGLYELHNTTKINFFNNTLTCNAGSFGTIVLEDRVSNGTYSNNVLDTTLCNASIQLLNNSNGTFSRNYDVRGVTYYNTRNFTDAYINIINQASLYPRNNIKNTSNGVILATNFDNYSSVLVPNQQIEVGDFTINTSGTNTILTSPPYDYAAVKTCQDTRTSVINALSEFPQWITLALILIAVGVIITIIVTNTKDNRDTGLESNFDMNNILIVIIPIILTAIFIVLGIIILSNLC